MVPNYNMARNAFVPARKQWPKKMGHAVHTRHFRIRYVYWSSNVFN